ncbi:unnamed protein product, partial [Rotaria sp. Silwood1]
MDENLLKISTSPDSNLSENSGHMCNFPSLGSSLTSDKAHNVINGLEHEGFFQDDFNFSRFSKMARCAKKDIPSTSLLDVLISPMSRLSTSSSLMSFSSLGNNKTSEQLLYRSTITNSTDQLIVPNENANLFPPASSFLSLHTPLSNRQTLSSIDNIPLTTTDNDLQRVPPSFILMKSPSAFTNSSMLHSQPQPQIVHSTTRSNTMPSWRGYLPMKF